MNFFESIVSFFEFIGNAIENVFDSLMTFIDVISMSFLLPPILATFIPSIIYSSGVIFIGITVVRKIFGR